MIRNITVYGFGDAMTQLPPLPAAVRVWYQGHSADGVCETQDDYRRLVRRALGV